MEKRKHSLLSKKIDILILIIFLLFGNLYSYITRDLYIGKALFSGIVFILFPAIYLGLRSKKFWKKIILSTIIFGGLFGFFFEFIQELNGSYHVVSSVLPKIFNIIPIDNILGHMMMTFLTLVFYEHFIDRKKSSHLSKNIFFALLPALSVIFLSLVIFFIKPDLLIISYSYFYMGIAAIIPPIFLGFSKPIFIKDMAVTAIYFFFLYFFVEIFAVKFGWWIYPGNSYVGQIYIFGITYPFEELFFWMMFYAASLVSYYELFVDNN